MFDRKKRQAKTPKLDDNNDDSHQLAATYTVWMKIGVPKDSKRAADWGSFSPDEKEVLIRIIKDKSEGTILEIEEKGIVIFSTPSRYLQEMIDSTRYFLLTIPTKDVAVMIAFHDKKQAKQFVKKIRSDSLIRRPEQETGKREYHSSEWLMLPDETQLMIFEYLSPKEVCQLGLTCSRWQMLVNDNHLWKGLCERTSYLSSEEDLVNKFHGSYKLCYVYHLQSSKMHMPDEQELLKKLGIRQIETNGMVPMKMVITGTGKNLKNKLMRRFTGCEKGIFDPVVNLDRNNISWLGPKTTINIGLHTTAGQEDYDRLRPLGYCGADAVIIIFSLVHPQSFADVIEKWYPEVKAHCSRGAILLVGMKPNARADPVVLNRLRSKNLSPITTAEGLRLASKGFAHYVECSFKDPKSVNKVFELAILSALTAGWQDASAESGDKKRCITN